MEQLMCGNREALLMRLTDAALVLLSNSLLGSIRCPACVVHHALGVGRGVPVKELT